MIQSFGLPKAIHGVIIVNKKLTTISPLAKIRYEE